jgi:hypothetical protein
VELFGNKVVCRSNSSELQLRIKCIWTVYIDIGIRVYFEVFTVVLLKVHIFCDVMLCQLDRSRSFEGTQCRHIQGQEFPEDYSRWIVGYIIFVWVKQCTHCLRLKTEKTRN